MILDQFRGYAVVTAHYCVRFSFRCDFGLFAVIVAWPVHAYVLAIVVVQVLLSLSLGM